MGVKVTGDSDIEARLDSKRFMQRVAVVMDDVLEDGAHEMQQNIETRGTGREWSRPWGPNGRTGSYPGRVDTGQMVREVQGEVVSTSANRVTGVLGWPEDSPDYYRLQEHGFYHTLTQEDVDGMRALADAEASTTPALVNALIQIAKS